MWVSPSFYTSKLKTSHWSQKALGKVWNHHDPSCQFWLNLDLQLTEMPVLLVDLFYLMLKLSQSNSKGNQFAHFFVLLLSLFFFFGAKVDSFIYKLQGFSKPESAELACLKVHLATQNLDHTLGKASTAKGAEFPNPRTVSGVSFIIYLIISGCKNTLGS